LATNLESADISIESEIEKVVGASFQTPLIGTQPVIRAQADEFAVFGRPSDTVAVVLDGLFEGLA
jgi:hypothetical protein